MKKSAIYRRILLKLTGELFGFENHFGINFEAVNHVARSIADLLQTYGIQLAIVVGGGNLFRGRLVEDTKFDRAQADHIGMLGTVMNALALQTMLEELGVEVRVMSALNCNAVCEPFILRKARTHLDLDRTIILAGGTGAAFFTTDSAAALKAAELECDVLLKGSNVDGVYTANPRIDPNAKMYSKLTFQEAIERRLMVMDNTAFAMCQRESIPIIVFNCNDFSNIHRILDGEEVGTIITE